MNLLIGTSFFIGLLLSILAIYTVIAFARSDIKFKDWVKGSISQGAVASAGLGIGVIVLFIITFFFLPNNAHAQQSDMFKKFTDVTYLNFVEVYIGIDYTKGVSPQCRQGGVDDRGTSNMGVRVNAINWVQLPIKLNYKLTHHSCVLGKDTNGYDSFLGVELVYTPWVRKR